MMRQTHSTRLQTNRRRRCHNTSAHALLLAIFCVMAAVPTLGVAAEPIEINAGGVTRTAWIHVPEGLEVNSSAPVVLAFHGSTWNGQTMEQVTGFSEIADREGFIVAYPDGTGPGDILSWNAGYCCSFALEQQADDLLFVDELLDALIDRYPVDVHRIYATGFSNGAMFTYSLALERPERFAAIAVVAGAMYPSQQPSGVPVPVLIIHGTNDVVIPFEGGWGALGSLSGRTEPAIPVDQAVEFWTNNNGCAQDSSTLLTERNARMKTYATCNGDTEVQVITLVDGDHTWPAIATRASDFILSADGAELLESLTINTTSDTILWDLLETGIHASEQIWKFFARHER